MFDFSCMSSKGERIANEDSIKIVKKDNLFAFILADGLGGHGKGEIASFSAVDAVSQHILDNDFNENMLKECFIEAIKGVKNAQSEHNFSEMRTTLVVLIINDGKAYWGHIGDSRLYLFNKGKYEYRTTDHSVPQALVNMGEIKEEDIRHHSERNRLLRAIGSDNDNIDDILDIGGENIDITDKSFILCSDGFWEWIEEKDMQSMLNSSYNADTWISSMVDLVVKTGCGNHMDNFSVITVYNKKSAE